MFYFDNALVSQVDTTARYNPGQKVIDPATGREFRYVKQIGATTSAVGELAAVAAAANALSTGWGAVSRTAATSLIGTISTVAVAAGVFQSVLATGKFGWVQVAGDGRVALAVTDGNVVAGDVLIIGGGATPIGACLRMPDGQEEAVFGYATADDVGTVQSASTYFLTLR